MEGWLAAFVVSGSSVLMQIVNPEVHGADRAERPEPWERFDRQHRAERLHLGSFGPARTGPEARNTGESEGAGERPEGQSALGIRD